MLFGMPIWVLLCIVLVFVSAYMAFKAMRTEKQVEQRYIEQEGQVYLKRIEAEREKRNSVVNE